MRAAALCAAAAALATPSGSEMSLPMAVERWDHTAEWRPYVREAVQAVLSHVDGATGVEQIHEHKSRVAATAAYTAEVEFAPSSDGRKPAFNGTAWVFDSSLVLLYIGDHEPHKISPAVFSNVFGWWDVAGTTLHTQLHVDEQRRLNGPPAPPPDDHRLWLLNGVADRETPPAPRPLLPGDVAASIDFDLVGAGRFLLSAGVPMGRLSTGAMERPEPEGVAHELVVSDGVEAQMTGVESLELLDPLPLECDLPFRWHPPLIFPPLSGGTRLSGWFLLEGIAQVDPGGSLSVSLSPSKRPDQRSMPSGVI